jgi:hypothetical protein
VPIKNNGLVIEIRDIDMFSAGVIIIIGLAALFLGRKLYWLFVGLAGFLLGVILSEIVMGDSAIWSRLLVALVFGLLGVLLAYFAKRLAIAVAGFIIGAFVPLLILNALGLEFATWTWVVAIMGGILGVILVSLLFDVGLILLSSLGGAALVVGALDLSDEIRLGLYILLAIVGVVFQFATIRRG